MKRDLAQRRLLRQGQQVEKSTDQAYLHMAGAFFDTVIMCSVTGLAIAASGVLDMTDDAGRMLDGVQLTMQAFSATSR